MPTMSSTARAGPGTRRTTTRGGGRRRVIRCDANGDGYDVALRAVAVVATTIVALGDASAATRAMEFRLLDQSQVEYLRRRDEAASFKCKSMFDCDGDRREFARAQSERLYARARTRDPNEADVERECTVEDPCTDNVLRAAMSGLQGLTTSEKLEKLGRSELKDAPNSTARYFDF